MNEISLRKMRVILTDPLGYLDFLKLMGSAKVVLTDSGGIQEETTILRVPCLTLRENTERPVTVEVGTNTLVGTDPNGILKGFQKVMKGDQKKGGIPELWDGKAAERIVRILLKNGVRLS
jgi:UDP-N-acetylglucosamine 2-epimerase (non-hydrolysing)